MFEMGEVTQFLSGELGDIIVISNQRDDIIVQVIRRDEKKLEIIVPVDRGSYHEDQFDIAKALSHPACGVSFSIYNNVYHIHANSRPQFYAVIKIALNHLGWHDDQKIVKQYQNK